MYLGHHQKGFSLIELMVAITISLVVLVALSGMFVTSSRARNEMQRAGQQIESGRYAMQVLTEDLQLAGYLAEFDVARAEGPAGDESGENDLAIPTAPAGFTSPDPCTTNLTSIQSNLAIHVQGYNSDLLPEAQVAVHASCNALLADRKENTDIIVIRRVNTCIAGVDDDCDDAEDDKGPWFQASACNDELISDDHHDWYRLTNTTSELNLSSRGASCGGTGTAPIRRFLTHIYFIARENEVGDSIPTLKRAELHGTVFEVRPIAEGIEDMQFEFGIDDNPPDPTSPPFAADNIRDGVVDRYAAGPASSVDWRDVMTIKISLLARTTTESVGHNDGDNTYTLGLQSTGDPHAVDPFADENNDGIDGFKRHVFESMVLLNNPAGRRQK